MVAASRCYRCKYEAYGEYESSPRILAQRERGFVRFYKHSPTLVWGLIARIHEVQGGTPQNHYHPGFCVPWRHRGYLWIEHDEERPNSV